MSVLAFSFARRRAPRGGARRKRLDVDVRTCKSVNDDGVLRREVRLARALDILLKPRHVRRALVGPQVCVARAPDEHVQLRDVLLGLLQSRPSSALAFSIGDKTSETPIPRYPNACGRRGGPGSPPGCASVRLTSVFQNREERSGTRAGRWVSCDLKFRARRGTSFARRRPDPPFSKLTFAAKEEKCKAQKKRKRSSARTRAYSRDWRPNGLTVMNAAESCTSSENGRHSRKGLVCVIFIMKFWQPTVE